MDLVSSIARLDDDLLMHAARLLVLVHTFSEGAADREIKGLTKLAKLDFFLRYPTYLRRALEIRGQSVAGIGVQSWEEHSIESKMVRYKYGPWDPRYPKVLSLLAAKGLLYARQVGNTKHFGLTEAGRSAAEILLVTPEFQLLGSRSVALKRHMNLTASNLVKFVYSNFPEIASLRYNESIVP